MDDDCPTADYCPTPEQIAEACERIQATWTPEQRLARRFGGEGVVGSRHEARFRREDAVRVLAWLPPVIAMPLPEGYRE